MTLKNNTDIGEGVTYIKWIGQLILSGIVDSLWYSKKAVIWIRSHLQMQNTGLRKNDRTIFNSANCVCVCLIVKSGFVSIGNSKHLQHCNVIVVVKIL